MKAIIFNSGLGKRMGEFTQTHHKSMVVLYNGETIFERQVRILSSCGIEDFVVTVGPFKEQIQAASTKFPNLHFHFVENPVYDQTNYIYSMYLARSFFDDDFLLLHGDLVFNEELVREMLEDKEHSLCLINEQKELPLKDFKGRVQDGKLREVSIHIFDSGCYAFQPLYKLKKSDLLHWSNQVVHFVENGDTGVYAENALNTILNDMSIYTKSYADHYIDEIDNLEDYERVNREICEFSKVKRK